MTFDTSDQKSMGRPLFFSLDAHIQAVESLIKSDEIDMALKLCDMVPAWYRENYPPELTEIKRTVARQLYDQIEYANDDEEANCTREFGEAQADNGYQFPRLNILEGIINEYCAGEYYAPWIFEVGCSHGNLPLALLKHGIDYWEYKGVGLNWRIVQKVREWVARRWCGKPIKNQPTILYCTEVLEHASRLEDIVITANKECVDWDVILLSVPLGTLGGGLPNWRDRRLGHVRTFTANELFQFANTSWPGYAWEMTLAPSTVIVGRK